MENNTNKLNVNNVKNEEGFTKKLGDKLERAGEKIGEKLPGVGERVEKLGDKIEHSKDKNRPNERR